MHCRGNGRTPTSKHFYLSFTTVTCQIKSIYGCIFGQYATIGQPIAACVHHSGCFTWLVCRLRGQHSLPVQQFAAALILLYKRVQIPWCVRTSRLCWAGRMRIRLSFNSTTHELGVARNRLSGLGAAEVVRRRRNK